MVYVRGASGHANPSYSPTCCALLHKLDKTSLQSIKRYNENGSPCRIPLDGSTEPLIESLTRYE